jgi:hypothetical protein
MPASRFEVVPEPVLSRTYRVSNDPRKAMTKDITGDGSWKEEGTAECRERCYFDCDHRAVRHYAIGITSNDSGDVGSYNEHSSNPAANTASNAYTERETGNSPSFNPLGFNPL